MFGYLWIIQKSCVCLWVLFSGYVVRVFVAGTVRDDYVAIDSIRSSVLMYRVFSAGARYASRLKSPFLISLVKSSVCILPALRVGMGAVMHGDCLATGFTGFIRGDGAPVIVFVGVGCWSTRDVVGCSGSIGAGLRK